MKHAGHGNQATRRACRVAFANICQNPGPSWPRMPQLFVRSDIRPCLSTMSSHLFHICFTFKFSCAHYISLSLCCLCPLTRYPLISTNIHYPLLLRSAKKITALSTDASAFLSELFGPECNGDFTNVHMSLMQALLDLCVLHFTDLCMIQPVSTVSNPLHSSSTFCSLSSTGCLSRKCSHLGIPEKSSGFGIARHPTFPTTNH